MLPRTLLRGIPGQSVKQGHIYLVLKLLDTVEQTICSDYKEEETTTIEKCFEEDDAYVFSYFSKCRTTTETTKVEVEALKTLTQVTERWVPILCD